MCRIRPYFKRNVRKVIVHRIQMKEFIMGKYFGTDGFRGEANVNLTVEHAYKVGRYIGWYFNQ